MTLQILIGYLDFEGIRSFRNVCVKYPHNDKYYFETKLWLRSKSWRKL